MTKKYLTYIKLGGKKFIGNTIPKLKTRNILEDTFVRHTLEKINVVISRIHTSQQEFHE